MVESFQVNVAKRFGNVSEKVLPSEIYNKLSLSKVSQFSPAQLKDYISRLMDEKKTSPREVANFLLKLSVGHEEKVIKAMSDYAKTALCQNWENTRVPLLDALRGTPLYFPPKNETVDFRESFYKMINEGFAYN